MIKMIMKLHRLGIAHGGIDASVFVFVANTNLKKGMRMRGFNNAVVDPRGLSRVALADLEMAYTILTTMCNDLEVLGNGGSVARSSAALNAIRPYIVCLNEEMTKKKLVKDIDQGEILRCLNDAIRYMAQIF
jgi:hypothetical protein